MSTLTLAYKADRHGNFSTPRTGQPWPGGPFVLNVKDRSIICGLKMFEENREILDTASVVTVLTYESRKTYAKAADIERFYTNRDVKAALASSKSGGAREIFCLGGKLTIEALAHYASKIVAIDVAKTFKSLQGADRPLWLPSFIKLDGILWRFETGPISFNEPFFTREVIAQRSPPLIF